jgi:cyanophycinase
LFRFNLQWRLILLGLREARGMAAADAHGGRLLLIGGAAGPALLHRFVCLAGGAASDIIVIATGERGSRDPGGSVRRGVPAARRGHGPAAAVGHPDTGQRPGRGSGVRGRHRGFFTGGDQQRITTVIGGTRADSELQGLLQAGAIVLGGTSAVPR